MHEVTSREEIRLKKKRTCWISRVFTGPITLNMDAPISFSGPRGMILAEDGFSPLHFVIKDVKTMKLKAFCITDAQSEDYVSVDEWKRNLEELKGYKGTNKMAPDAIVTRIKIMPSSLEELPDPNRRR